MLMGVGAARRLGPMQRAGASREIGNTPEKLCSLRYLELEAPGTSFLVDESKRWKLERRRTRKTERVVEESMVRDC